MGVAFEVLVAHGATWFPTAFVTIVAARGGPWANVAVAMGHWSAVEEGRA